jgi:hypothetical protein
MQSVNTANWSYCRFEKENFWAQITFGADPESLKEDRLEYYVTVLQDELHEVFQKKFETLTDACLYLNAQYSDWSFHDQTGEKTGCSTCAAH